ncbi:MAG TPA: phospholipid carrier-dependent glycosyltransferase [Micropruina sp.]|nr:phospholipid carrier-dependent glycosyltransferase [Micropruina sp.]
MSTIERLRDGTMTDAAVGWAVTLVITLLAFLIRLQNLAYPSNLVFDETYYAKDAWSLLKFGYEREWPKDANASIVAGNSDVIRSTAEFVVHPPLGKWLIALGEHWFGMNSFGWRFMACVFGSLLVLMVIRLARRLSRSTLIGGIAGLLLTLDGLAFVMSRTALLDIFQSFFIVAAVACCVTDRDWYRHRLADALEHRGLYDLHGEFGPVVWLRPWRLAAGVMFGAALACKWNSVFVLAVFGVLSVLWDVGARRLAGADWRSWLALLVDGIPAFFRLVVVAAAVYLATWIPWLMTSGGYDRGWGLKYPDHPWVKAFGEGFASLLWLHKEIYQFHTGDFINKATHPYDAHPAGWLAMLRPTGFDAVNDIAPGTDGCTGPENCIRVISAMGTPVLWWMAAIALVVCVVWWIGGRDWRFGVPVLGAVATYLPWFNYTDRPLFFFYAITIIPFTVIGLAMVLGLILGPANSPGRRRGAIIVGVAVALVALNFAWIYPALTDELLPYSQWLARMWLRSWI